MIWWRGGGLWIGFFAGIPVLALNKLGTTHIAIGYAISAAIVFMIRDWFGPGSSLFSIPTRFWPPLLLALALFFQFLPPGPQPVSDAEKAMTELRTSLPRKLIEKKQIRIDRSGFDNSTLHYYATSLVSFDGDSAQQAAIEQDIRKQYCEQITTLKVSSVGMALTLTVSPRSLNDRVETYSFAFQPKDCQSVSG
jgi:hypothetical protein